MIAFLLATAVSATAYSSSCELTYRVDLLGQSCVAPGAHATFSKSIGDFRRAEPTCCFVPAVLV